MKNKRIPTILGTFLLLAILFSGVWLSLQPTNTQSNASGDCSPIGVQVTNLTNKSVDISFVTSASCASTLSVNNKTIANFKNQSTIHYFRVDNLSAGTQYQYYLIINGQENRQSSYTFKTAPLPSGNLSTANLAWGKVTLASGQVSPNTIVYLNIPGAWPLSALTDNNGQWHISLSSSFTDDKSALFTPAAAGPEDIIVYSSDGQLTQVENSLAQNDPVPNIIIGQGFASVLGTGPGATIIPTKIITPTPVIIDTNLPAFSSSPSATIVPQATPTVVVPTIRTAKVSTKTPVPVTGNSHPLYFLLLSSLLTVSFSLYFFYRDEK